MSGEGRSLSEPSPVHGQGQPVGSCYFLAGAAAGAEVEAALEVVEAAVPGAAAFLCFFTCCFCVVAVEVLPLAGAL